jgi:hypothetical protein
MQMVPVAQPLAELARDGTESVFARVNCVLLISKQYPVRIVDLELITHIGTRHIPEHVNDLPSGRSRLIKSHG